MGLHTEESERPLQEACTQLPWTIPHGTISATDDRRVSMTVHIFLLKPYIDPDSCPIRQPPENVNEPFLSEDDLPDDSFLPGQPAAISLPHAINQDDTPDHTLPNWSSAISQQQSFDPAHLQISQKSTPGSWWCLGHRWQFHQWPTGYRFPRHQAVCRRCVPSWENSQATSAEWRTSVSDQMAWLFTQPKHLGTCRQYYL